MIIDYLVDQKYTTDDDEDIYSLFKKLDTKCDGVITVNELRKYALNL